MFSSAIDWSKICIFILAMKGVIVGEAKDLNGGNSWEEPEDARLNFTELAMKYAGVGEEHDVITEDGYVLKLFRLPRVGARPVLLQHGTLGSADDFILRGRTSLAVALYRAGYDVWASNIRGSIYSRRHLTLDPDADRQFWDYTLQEVAVLDTPAVVDHILAHVGRPQLAAVGYSVGTSVFYALGAERPEYNAKISLMISLAPIGYMHHSGILQLLHYLTVVYFDSMLEARGVDEIRGDKIGFAAGCLELFRSLNRSMASWLCFDVFASVVAGFDGEEIEPDFAPIVIAKWPSASARKFMNNFAQIGVNRRFARYDYGTMGNLARYGSMLPPQYDLSRADMPIALISGKDDQVSTLDDVELLKPELPNVVEHIILEPENYNHLDIIWGKHSHKVVLPYMLNLLEIHT